MKRLLTILSSLAVLSAAMAVIGRASGSKGDERAPPAARRPDIVLVTIDALRADHLSSYGYQQFTSPAIDAFARRAARFTNAIAQAPYTKASIASIMTGQYPSAHKTVTASVPFPETMTGHLTTAPIVTDVLPSSMTTLAEALRATGYQTLGFTANPFLIEAFGFARGFDRFRFYPGTDFARGERLVADAVDAARDADGRRPLFTRVHFMEPHSPYTPPPLTAGMFRVGGSPQPIPSQVSIPGWLLPGSPRDLRPYVAAYDDDISAVDAAVDTLLRELRTMRGWRDTIVVLTADHGEQFLDHGGWEHGSNLHDELIRVPLVIQAPSSPAGVIDAQVQLIDLFPTLLELAGAPLPATSGRALEVLWDPKSPSHPAMSEIVGVQSTLREEGFKLIAFPSGQAQLFNLARDPHEKVDVAAANPARVHAMQTALDRMRADALEAGRGVHTERVPIDPDVARRLRALGYVQR
jgi:arylsulfatase A-like enzyme